MANEVSRLDALTEGDLFSLNAIAQSTGLSVQDVVFHALTTAMGWAQNKAYRWLHPTCTDNTAKTGGCQVAKKIRTKLGEIGQEINLEACMGALSEFVKLKGMTGGDLETALKAADQYHRTRGHYTKHEKPVANNLQVLFNLASKMGGQGEVDITDYSDPALRGSESPSDALDDGEVLDVEEE